MIKQLVIGGILWSLCLLAGAVEPAQGAEFGIVDRVDFNASALVVDDMYYPMALNIKVFDVKGKEANRYTFKVGQKIMFTINAASGVRQLDEVWLMPADAERPVDGDDD